MIENDQGEWLPVHDAARQVLVRPSTIYVWINRHAIRFHRVRTPGRAGKPRVYVNMPDVMAAEKAWRDRETRRKRREVDSEHSAR